MIALKAATDANETNRTISQSLADRRLYRTYYAQVHKDKQASDELVHDDQDVVNCSFFKNKLRIPLGRVLPQQEQNFVVTV